MNSPYTALRVTAIRNETRDTKSFVLAPALPYRPGQFLTLVFPQHINEERRSYSISSTALLNEPLTITVKRIDNGTFSRYLFDACREGSVLYTIGASGFFTLPEQPERFEQFFFFAGGSGITPILPLIKTILHTMPAMRVYLVYSNHTPESTIFLQEIRELQEQFAAAFHVEFLFSVSKNLLKARLSKVLLSELLHQWVPRHKDKALFYLCGPHAYMQMISITLLTEGVPAQNIRKEIFDTVKPVVRELPPDQDPHHVTIRYDGNTYRFSAQFPVTILETAKRHGIVLPYSCEAGKCGTCAATCVAGKVWMSYNEVLLDKELEQGRVLTCTGYPVGSDITLEFPKAE